MIIPLVFRLLAIGIAIGIGIDGRSFRVGTAPWAISIAIPIPIWTPPTQDWAPGRDLFYGCHDSLQARRIPSPAQPTNLSCTQSRRQAVDRPPRRLWKNRLSGLAAGAMAVYKRSRRRSEERRVGKECCALCRSRWSPYH